MFVCLYERGWPWSNVLEFANIDWGKPRNLIQVTTQVNTTGILLANVSGLLRILSWIEGDARRLPFYRSGCLNYLHFQDIKPFFFYLLLSVPPMSSSFLSSRFLPSDTSPINLSIIFPSGNNRSRSVHKIAAVKVTNDFTLTFVSPLLRFWYPAAWRHPVQLLLRNESFQSRTPPASCVSIFSASFW